MREISRCALAFALALTSAVSSAQESINKGDLPDPRSSVDQNPVSVGDVTLSGQGATAGKTRISNALSSSTDSTATGRAQSLMNKEVLQQQTVLGNTASQGVVNGRPPVMSEFQKFLFDSTGKVLPVFGSEFFANAPSTFAPILNSPVPADYFLGPGDELLIRAWGTIDIDFRATIDRNGTVTIPTVGSIVLGGVKAGEAEGVIRGAVEKLYKGVTLNVNFGQLRAITVYVVGQANRPGTYTVSSLSTLVTALFASGGPNPNGSMRQVQVKRAGKVVADLDLYAFIAKGDKSADIKLQDGDSIYIPPAKGFVALVGKVNSPSIYELRGGSDSVESMLDFAGGLPIVADPRRAFLERVDPRKAQPRSVEQFSLTADGLKKVLKNGDVLNITSITPDFSNAVVLRGNVDQAIRAPFHEGMRVSDLIPSRDYLISRKSIHRQNSVIGLDDSDDRISARDDGVRTRNGEGKLIQQTEDRGAHEGSGTIASHIGGLLDAINWDYAVVERINRADLTVSLVPFNLGKIFENPASAENVLLQPGDTVTIFSQQDVLIPIDKRRVFVRVEGEVNVPGVYQMAPGENLQSLVTRAGGVTPNAYLFATAFYREQVRREQEANLEKVAARLDTQLRGEQSKTISNARAITPADAQITESRRQADLLSAKDAIARVRQLKPTGRIAFSIDPKDKTLSSLPPLRLENGDKLVIPPRPDFIHVFGAVNAEASPLWRANTSVEKYLKISGVTSDADLENIFVIRVDGSVLAGDSGKWFSGGIVDTIVLPGDTIVVPEKIDKETAWSRFMLGAREWTQIIANFGLGAAAIKVLK
ncbi:protein involved in polysaccharide export with SLBB domain [Oxalobacteraceae bacterium GrIS 1.11]